MDYFDFNPTMIEKWDRLARMDHPISGTHYYLHWLWYAGGYRAVVVVSYFQLDDEVVALRGLDRARVDSHMPYIPDDGETYDPRTLDWPGQYRV